MKNVINHIISGIYRHGSYQLPVPGGYVFGCVCLSVRLSVFMKTPKEMNRFFWKLLCGRDWTKVDAIKLWERSGSYSGYQKILNFQSVPFSIYFEWLSLSGNSNDLDIF